MTRQDKKLSNWSKTLIILIIMAALLWIPLTRQMVLFVLPLGSGIDDLIFFILCTLIILTLLIRGNMYYLRKLASWFHK